MSTSVRIDTPFYSLESGGGRYGAEPLAQYVAPISLNVGFLMQ
jgi:hypothetical protein